MNYRLDLGIEDLAHTLPASGLGYGGLRKLLNSDEDWKPTKVDLSSVTGEVCSKKLFVLLDKVAQLLLKFAVFQLSLEIVSVDIAKDGSVLYKSARRVDGDLKHQPEVFVTAFLGSGCKRVADSLRDQGRRIVDSGMFSVNDQTRVLRELVKSLRSIERVYIFKQDLGTGSFESLRTYTPTELELKDIPVPSTDQLEETTALFPAKENRLISMGTILS